MDAMRRRDAAIVTVKISRQAGKNELSSQLEALTLGLHRFTGGAMVKAAPTLLPQANISRLRLERQLRAMSIPFTRDRFKLTAGNATIDFASAAPSSETVGLTASLLLEIDEAQDVEPAKYEKDFDPMRASTGAPAVFWGTAWADDSLLERMAAEPGAIAISIPWWEVAQDLPAYGAYVEKQRARMGPNNPIFRANYEGVPITNGLGMIQVTPLIKPYAEEATPHPGATYVGAIDFAGVVRSDDEADKRDATVLAVAAIEGAGTPTPTVRVVAIFRMDYEDSRMLALSVAHLAAIWKLRALGADATGLGGPIAADIAKQAASVAPGTTVLQVVATPATKSAIGYHLIASAQTGRLEMPGAGPSHDVTVATLQLGRLRATYLPGGLVRWSAPGKEHDDHAYAVALANHIAHDLPDRRVATGRSR